MTRVCPNCKKQLKESDVYFCTNCGEEITENVSTQGTSYTIKVTKFSSNASTFNFRPILIIVISLAGVIGVFMLIKVGVRLLPTKRINFQQQVTQTTDESTPATWFIKSKINAITHKFEDKSLITFVPSEVDFYLESSDFKAFYQAFTSEFDRDPFIDVLINDVESVFIVAGRQVESAWELGLFLKVFNQDKILENLNDLGNENWRVVLVRDTILISNSDKFIEDVVNSSNGIAKNITHNPKYVTKKSQLVDKGQLIFISLDDDPVPAFNLLNYYNASDTLLSIAEQAKKLEYDKFVLTNE